MTSPEQFTFGDRVIHASNPEWGTGQVLSAQIETQEGEPSQRLKIRFSRAGLKTLSTRFAQILPAESSNTEPLDTAPSQTSSSGWLAEHERATPEALFEAIPEACSDPFASLRSRIDETLRLWRFSDDGASIIDWASVQLGMDDPLTRFNRHELEQYFRRFANAREAHLAKIMHEARQKEPELYQQLLDSSGPASRAVRQIHAKR
ncbi:MAG: DUF3553 domain-containing protein [Planctomycetota bacterium]|jgi:hypothetical protein